ncbi:hypothetical protein XENOCAPTIV_029303 [Xenoophorus captivus]|uniref:Uncharacterized protein n=1 Tax=Xenoophorus captivus TaxID=1517983 RepID=A0ABV0RVL3_9TELE
MAVRLEPSGTTTKNIKHNISDLKVWKMKNGRNLTRLFSCCPPRVRLSCCCCGDMLSIQSRRLSVQLSLGDAAEREIPLITSASGTRKTFQQKPNRNKTHVVCEERI